MKGLWLLGIGAAALGASYLYAVQNAGANLHSTITKVSWKGIKGGVLVLGITIQSSNPTNQDLYIDSGDLNVYLPEGKILARINHAFGKTMPILANATSSNELDVNIDLNLGTILNLGPEIINAIKTGKLPQYLEIKGNLVVNGLPTQYDEKYPISKQNAIMGIALPESLSTVSYVNARLLS